MAEISFEPDPYYFKINTILEDVEKPSSLGNPEVHEPSSLGLVIGNPSMEIPNRATANY